MASSTKFLLILFISFLGLSTQFVFSSSDNHLITSNNLPNTLFQKGYLSMSIILENTLNRLISSAPNNNNTTFTIFCPTEKAFLKLVSKYPDPPYRLIQYQVVPLKINKEILETSIPKHSKLETLLPGHSIVITTLPDAKISINNVNVVEWNVYNNERVIVHGVDEFFDPALEILVYPNNDKYVEKTEKKKSFESVIGYWLSHPLLSQLILLLIMILVFVIGSLCYLVLYKLEDEEYRIVDDHIAHDKYVLLEEDDADVKDVQSFENIL